MRKASILLVILVLMLFNGCSFIGQKGYIIEEASSASWKFSGGKLLIKGGEQELKYSIAYIGKDELKPLNLNFDFFIALKNSENKKDLDKAEHLHSNINSYVSKKVDTKYSKKDSFKGKLLESNKEYDFEKLYLRISYEIDGKKHEEVIELPMENIRGN
jgi:hypothetical protein